MKKILRRFVILIVALIVIGWASLFIYSLDYNRADDQAVAIYDRESVSVDGSIQSFNVPNSKLGFIFYPGGKVEASAYAVLASQLQDAGINVFIVEMPFNLAVFDINAANKVRKDHPLIEQWYIGGHSLGGAMASSHIGSNEAYYDGLILLAAYPINDATLPTIILYGENDGVLSMDKIEPFSDDALEIQGGNHAYFGNYGLQKGDGEASITREKQQEMTIKAILSFIQNN